MAKSKFSKAKRAAIVAEQTKERSVEAICRDYQISSATFYQWKRAIVEGKDVDRRRLRELEAENKRLKKMFAELSIDHDILKQGFELAKKFAAQDAKRK